MDIINRIQYLLEQYQMLILPLGILVSLAQCFFGYRYLKAWIAMLGFLAGLGGGYIISSRLLSGSSYAPVLIGILSGIILTLLSYMIYKAGLFVLCAVITGETVWNLPILNKISNLNLPGSVGDKIVALLPIVIVLVCAVAVGILALKITRTCVIVATGFTGAYRAIMYLATLLSVDMTTNPETRYVWLGVIALLALLGIVVQFFTTKE